MDERERNWRDRLTRAAALALPYTERLPIQGERQAAVLMLLGFPADPAAGPSLLITRRADGLSSHRSEMAFPGGMCDHADLGLVVRTALRETDEEVGIPADHVEVLGELPELVTGTGFRVIPVVGQLCGRAFETMPLRINVDELAEAFWVSLATLAAPETYAREWREHGAIRFPTHVYRIGPHRIWGATGAMIKNLLDRLAALS